MTAAPSRPEDDQGAILALNAGSSSLKFALFAAGEPLRATLRGEVSGLDTDPHLIAHDGAGDLAADRHMAAATVLDGALDAVLDLVGHSRLHAVGHRIVHGGADHVAPERVTPSLLAALEALTPLDPVHMPLNLAPVRAMTMARPGIAQVVCFDTAFHHTLPPVARLFALPHAISAAGVRRYGFHGLSFEYVARTLARERPGLAKGRVVVAHLGAGASLCALANGESIATTMGLGVLDGLMMATRCGSIDPGVIFHLARLGHSLADIEDMLTHRSGLLGVSGISADPRVLLASADPQARLAIDLFTYRIALEMGAMTAALGGLDGIVFTAGIGQHSSEIRAAVCARLGWLGIALDPAANLAGHACISSPASKVEVRVMATDEEAMIAHHVRAMLVLPGGRGT